MNDPWRSRIVGHGEESPGHLIANPRNWRIHPKRQQDALSGVLSEVGWVQSIIVNERTGFVVDGHARVEIAVSRGEPTVPVVYVDLDENEEGIVLAALDPIGAMAGTDRDKCADLLADLAISDEALLAFLKPAGAGLTDPDDVPAVTEPISKTGDLWLLGEHRLLCGDSTEPADVARLMDDKKAEMVFTDPPYGVNVKGKGGNAIAGDISFTAIPLMFDVLDRVMAPGAWAYICGGQSNLLLYARMFERYFRQLPMMIVWDKGRTAVMRHNGYHSCYELIYYAFREGGGGKWNAPRTSDHADDIWRISVDADKDREHVTQKPVALPERAMENSSQPGEIILDPFSGSGSTLIASERLGRRCYAMEIAEQYVDVAAKRWQAFTGREAILESTGETLDRVAARVKSEGHTNGKHPRSPSPSSSARSKGREQFTGREATRG